MRRSAVIMILAVGLGLACSNDAIPVAVEEPVAHEATASLPPCDAALASHIRNLVGQLGDGTTNDSPTPVAVR